MPEDPKGPPESENNATKIHPAVEFFYREWRVIKTVSFWIAIGIVAIGVFGLLSWHFSGVMDEKDAQEQRTASDRDSFKRQRDDAEAEVIKLRAAIPSGYDEYVARFHPGEAQRVGNQSNDKNPYTSSEEG